MRVNIPTPHISTPHGGEKIRVGRRERPGIFRILIGLIGLAVMVISFYNIIAQIYGSSLPEISILEWLRHSEGVDTFVRIVIPDSVIEQL